MKSVLFYTQNRWAFGQIHHALIKRLWEHKVFAHLLDWTQPYSRKEFQLLNSRYDTFVTTPEAIHALISHGVSPSKIVSIAHSEKDIAGGIQTIGTAGFDSLKRYGVVHSDLIQASVARGVARIPDLVRVGIDFDHYYTPVKDALKVIGYAGENEHKTVHDVDCKRTYLLSPVMEGMPFEFRAHEFYNHICMSGYYPTIDAILVPSSSETAGLPAMEAAAAGRLVISTKVGYFDGSAGILCRNDDEGFVVDARRALLSCSNPSVYKSECERAQQHARDHYDWSCVMDKWLELLA
jgi:glycosyltransferase involved in cell wall biosynthesis